jgi:hypothetical protein
VYYTVKAVCVSDEGVEELTGVLQVAGVLHCEGCVC